MDLKDMLAKSLAGLGAAKNRLLGYLPEGGAREEESPIVRRARISKRKSHRRTYRAMRRVRRARGQNLHTGK